MHVKTFVLVCVVSLIALQTAYSQEVVNLSGSAHHDIAAQPSNILSNTPEGCLLLQKAYENDRVLQRLDKIYKILNFEKSNVMVCIRKVNS